MDEGDPVHIVVEKAAAEANIAPGMLVSNVSDAGDGDAKFVNVTSNSQAVDHDNEISLSEDTKDDGSGGQDEAATVSYITSVGDHENMTLQIEDDQSGENQTYIFSTDEAGNMIQHVQQGEGQVIMQGSETFSGESQVIQVEASDGQTEYDLSSAQIVTMRGGADGTTQYITLPTSSSGQVFTLPVSLPDGTTQTQIITLPEEYSQSGGQLVFSMSDVPGDQDAHTITTVLPTDEQIQAGSSTEQVTLQTGSSTDQMMNMERIILEIPQGLKVGNSNIKMTSAMKRPQQMKMVQPQKKKLPPKPPKPPPVPAPPPKPDLENPIQLSEETVVVVRGKKCFLRCNPDTGEFTAYPVKQELPPGKRRRGRPRKEEKVFDPNAPLYKQDKATTGGCSITMVTKEGSDVEQTNSAAEGLLELSNVDADGVRRSSRRKKQARVLDDYELGAVLSDDDTEAMVIDDGAIEYEDEEDDEEEEIEEPPAKRGRGRPRKYSDPSVAPPQVRTPSNPPPPGVKRGRGRPRRNPAPVHQPPDYSGPIPALIIANPNGSQTIMLAPGQNLQTLQKLPPILPKLTTNTEAGKTHVVLQSTVAVTKADATSTQITSQPFTASSEIEAALNQICRHENPDDNATLKETAEAAAILAAVEGTKDIKVERDETLQLGTQTVEVYNNGQIGIQTTQDGEQAQEINNDASAVTENENNLPEGVTAAMVQLPPELIPTFIPGKTPPIKLGLKANEDDLWQLKCQRCDFQAYYPQQYQDHLRTAHDADVEKCKCCNFATFEKDDLMKHFKASHPRNICTVCDFIAEHAYVIKRHMMRHNSTGCECELCGRTYKDQYILKMHIKMVHMPAEVLFECTVCAKKFTRKAHLKRHLRIHDPEKPFKCPHCDYRGCEKSDITKHLLIHEDPKHCCEVCGKSFRHIKNKELHLKRHKGQRDYKCGVCDFYGYTFTDIRKHIERKHTDNRIMACDRCGTAFKSELMLREHQKRTCGLLQAIAAAANNQSDQASIVEVPGISLNEMGQVSIDGSQVISVENVRMPDGTLVNFSEAQQLTDAQLDEQQIAVSEVNDIDQSEVEMVTHISVSEGQIIEATQLSMADPNALAGTHIPSSDIAKGAVHVIDINDTTDPEGQELELVEDEEEEEDGEDIDIHEVIQDGEIPDGTEIHQVITDNEQVEGIIQSVTEEGQVIQILQEDGKFHQVIHDDGHNYQVVIGDDIHEIVDKSDMQIVEDDRPIVNVSGDIGIEVISNEDVLPDNQVQIIQISQIAEAIAKEQENQEQL